MSSFTKISSLHHAVLTKLAWDRKLCMTDVMDVEISLISFLILHTIETFMQWWFMSWSQQSGLRMFSPSFIKRCSFFESLFDINRKLWEHERLSYKRSQLTTICVFHHTLDLGSISVLFSKLWFIKLLSSVEKKPCPTQCVLNQSGRLVFVFENGCNLVERIIEVWWWINPTTYILLKVNMCQARHCNITLVPFFSYDWSEFSNLSGWLHALKK